MENTPNSPVFADRYRLEPVGNDWDRGRSGYTHLVYDLKEKRLGVIKRAETISEQAVVGLKNEASTLNALKGLGVPEVYDAGQAVYGSKSYYYMVIEYLDGIRIERELNSLDAAERIDILTQFFGLLTQAHQKGIVNGDVDLKHLFWSKDKKKLFVIDWGNAKLNVDPNKRTEFAYDLARAAEIIFSLVTRQGHPQSTGPISLPDASGLVKGLEVLPIKFLELCKWAPRTPSDGAQAPFTAQELFEASRKWPTALSYSMSDKTARPKQRSLLLWLSSLFILLFIIVAAFLVWTGKSLWSDVATSTSIVASDTHLTSTIPPKLTDTPLPSITPIQNVSTPIQNVPTPIQSDGITPTVPSPLTSYSPLLVFNEILLPEESRKCVRNDIPSPALNELEGFFNRSYLDSKEDWWVFNVASSRNTNEIIQTDFAPCLEGKLGAIALNVSVTKLVPWKEDENVGNEFGLFVEGKDKRREYTIWVDKDEKMHLRIRDGSKVYDKEILIVSSIDHSKADGVFYNHFILQIFLEVDNQGMDILYMLESYSEDVKFKDIKPSGMIQIDGTTLPTIGDVQKVGLVGHGGQTTLIVWPLAFLTK